MEPYLTFRFYSRAVHSSVLYAFTIKTFSMMTIPYLMTTTNTFVTVFILMIFKKWFKFNIFSKLIISIWTWWSISFSRSIQQHGMNAIFNFPFFLAEVFHIQLNPTDDSFLIRRASKNICHVNPLFPWVEFAKKIFSNY